MQQVPVHILQEIDSRMLEQNGHNNNTHANGFDGLSETIASQTQTSNNSGRDNGHTGSHASHNRHHNDRTGSHAAASSSHRGTPDRSGSQRSATCSIAGASPSQRRGRRACTGPGSEYGIDWGQGPSSQRSERSARGSAIGGGRGVAGGGSARTRSDWSAPDNRYTPPDPDAALRRASAGYRQSYDGGGSSVRGDTRPHSLHAVSAAVPSSRTVPAAREWQGPSDTGHFFGAYALAPAPPAESAIPEEKELTKCTAQLSTFVADNTMAAEGNRGKLDAALCNLAALGERFIGKYLIMRDSSQKGSQATVQFARGSDGGMSQYAIKCAPVHDKCHILYGYLYKSI